MSQVACMMAGALSEDMRHDLHACFAWINPGSGWRLTYYADDPLLMTDHVVSLLRPQACAVPTMLPSVRPTQTHVGATNVGPALHTPPPFCGSARPRASAQCCSRAAPSRHYAQAGSPPDTTETSGHGSHTQPGGSPAAASRRGLLLGAAAAVAASLAGEQQAHAVQGLTAGRLPGMHAT